MKSRLAWLPGILVVFLAFRGLGDQAAFGQGQTGDCLNDLACKVLAERAKQQSATGSLAEAFRLYSLAYSVREDPMLLFNLARVLHRQGRTLDSIPYYKEYLDSPVADEEQKAKARAYLEQAQLAPPEIVSMPPHGLVLPKETMVSLKAAPGSLKGTAIPGRDRVVPKRTPESFVKKRWFWLVLGGSVLAASSITAGVMLKGGNSAPPAAARMMLPTNTATFMF